MLKSELEVGGKHAKSIGRKISVGCFVKLREFKSKIGVNKNANAFWHWRFQMTVYKSLWENTQALVALCNFRNGFGKGRSAQIVHAFGVHFAVANGSVGVYHGFL